MELSPSGRALLDALAAVATRATTADFTRLTTWVRRALRNGHFPSGVAVADVLDLQLAVIRRGRCPVPYCSLRTSRAKGPENEYRLCRAHLRFWREGGLKVSGPPDSPSFFSSDGTPIAYRSG